MKQLHDRYCFKPVDVSTLTAEQRQRALESLIFLTEKRSGEIKTRQCANGSTQRLYTKKEDCASPTVSLPSVIMTSIIDAWERREVAIVDIPNAFVQTENTGEPVFMKIRGEMARMLVELSPETYQPFLVHDQRGEPVLYVQVMKALYGMLQSSLL